ncbi:hypothetical protein AMAG_14354 [Allomyces macrogynus ATCC 38327]|uniref:RING-type domain-containing protein n=1 Tax=Allomyces macrogynus (strain ATCC 38327) TaxID=578462 RepID=A0A0L0T4T2_ALLM3|nr:hypothetical protein AMAG_14354 [Allomyces macrogynus ATCC 38327]|eukprot:KNE69818.1 hypothetical protein AMAG_14354 [Allomyces macrogynus ATCC 38327]
MADDAAAPAARPAKRRRRTTAAADQDNTADAPRWPLPLLAPHHSPIPLPKTRSLHRHPRRAAVGAVVAAPPDELDETDPTLPPHAIDERPGSLAETAHDRNYWDRVPPEVWADRDENVAPQEDQDGGDDDPATSWWRFYPDVLEEGGTPARATRRAERIGGDDSDDDDEDDSESSDASDSDRDRSAVASSSTAPPPPPSAAATHTLDNDDDLLAAAVQAQAALRNRANDYASTYDLLRGRGLPAAATMPGPAGINNRQPNNAADDEVIEYREPEPDANLLFLCSSDTFSTCRRLPLPTGFLTNDRCAPRGLIVARVEPYTIKELVVRRPRIGTHGRYVYDMYDYLDWENVTYRLPDTDPRVINGQWDQVTDEDFLELERADPYSSRVVRPTPGARNERVEGDVVTQPPAPISRKLETRLKWRLAADAEYMDDGDARPLAERNGGDHNDDAPVPDAAENADGGEASKARFRAGQPVPAFSDIEWARKWTPAHAPFYTLVLRAIRGSEYDHGSETRDIPRQHYYGAATAYRYHLCIYVDVAKAVAAINRGAEVPLLGHFLFKAASLIRTVRTAELPKLYVPDTLEGGHAELDVLPGFQHTLRPYQKRSLGWLVALERDPKARTLWVRKLPDHATTLEKSEFESYEAADIPVVVALAQGGPWFNLYTRQWARVNYWARTRAPIVPVECRGALEVSRVGAGKTVTALALVHANPFSSVREIPWAHPGDRDRYLVSRATLVVVRSDLAAQWYNEAKRALPPSAKIFQLTTIHEYRKMTWNDLLLADVVIVSTAFLQNTNYRARILELIGAAKYHLPPDSTEGIAQASMYDDFGHFRSGTGAITTPYRDWELAASTDSYHAFTARMDRHLFWLNQRGRSAFGKETNAVILERVHFHRAVIDECHELGVVTASQAESQPEYAYRRGGGKRKNASKTEKAEMLLSGLRASFWLGLTGTPPINKPESVLALAESVHVHGLPKTRAAAQAFLNGSVRRNNPTLTVPPVHYRTEWVTMTAAEMGLMASLDTHGALPTLARLMMCNHHQITDALVALTGTEGEHTVDQVAALLQTVRETKMADHAKHARDLQTDLAKSLGRLHALVVTYPNVAAALPGTGVTVVQPGNVIRVDGHVALTALALEAHVPVGPGKPDPVPENAVPVPIPSAAATRSEAPRTDAQKWARRLVQAYRELADVQRQLRAVAGEWNFMNAVLDAIRSAEAQACPLCLEEIEVGQPLVMTRCGHVYCTDCSRAMLQRVPRRCAICRGDLEGAHAVTRMVLAPPEAEGEGEAEEKKDEAEKDEKKDGEEGDGIDYAKYGSKIRALVAYVRRVLAADPTAKLILFSQFRRLTALISRAFSEFNIPNVRMAGGNVLSKRRAVTLFRTDPDMKVLFLSSDDCVSGLHLTEANHVVIVHPFLGASETMSRAYEMQGIARAVRAGQTREVTVVRFVTRNTIEEEMTARRTDVQLAPAAMAAVAVAAAEGEGAGAAEGEPMEGVVEEGVGDA